MSSIRAIGMTKGRKQFLSVLRDIQKEDPIVHVYIFNHCENGTWKKNRVFVSYFSEDSTFLVVNGCTYSIVVKIPDMYLSWKGTGVELKDYLSVPHEGIRLAHHVIEKFVVNNDSAKEHETLKDAFETINLGEDASTYILQSKRPIRIRRKKYSPWKDSNQLRLFPEYIYKG